MPEQWNDKDKWNQRYHASVDLLSPSRVLAENSHLLPRQGNALDLACGLGANAIFLAKQGLKTSAWDISDIAIEKLNSACKNLSLQIDAEVRDVELNPPLQNSFDVIVVCRFLDRNLMPSLIDAVRPGGLIFYQTFVVDKHADAGPSNPDYLLQQNELLRLFQCLTVRVYREEGLEGNQAEGFRNEAMLVAQKPRDPAPL